MLTMKMEKLFEIIEATRQNLRRKKPRCIYKCWACRNRCKGKDGHSTPLDFRGHFCKNHKRAR